MVFKTCTGQKGEPGGSGRYSLVVEVTQECWNVGGDFM